MKWIGKDRVYTYIIKKDGDTFDLDIKYLGDTNHFWFGSYTAARNFLRREYNFEGRMKKEVNHS